MVWRWFGGGLGWFGSVSTYPPTTLTFVVFGNITKPPKASPVCHNVVYILGPLMFFLYVNDIADKILPQTTIKLFAGDCPIQNYRFCR